MKTTTSISYAYLCGFILAIYCTSAIAQEPPVLTLSRSGATTTFNLSSTANASGCQIELYGSRSRRKLRSKMDHGTLIETTFANSAGSSLVAEDILPVRRTRRNPKRRVAFFVIARQDCSGDATQSKVKRIRIKSARGKSNPPAKKWLADLASKTADTSLRLESPFSHLQFNSPVDLQNADDGSNRLFVVEQGGVIWVLDLDDASPSKQEFLDISGKIEPGRELGLLGLAFHPDYAVNGYFYVYYSEKDSGDSIIARYTVSSSDSNAADSSSELIFLRVAQPTVVHQGGQIAFGPDGFLYIAFGDGGPQLDANGNGQNRATLLGSLLRIDVDTPDGGENYSIPASNPFKNNSDGYKEEIFAWGFRNPWRFSFDSEDGAIWLADVGQNATEEIDIIKNGKNYGWAITEGSGCLTDPSCSKDGLVDPVYEYSHAVGTSITGGYVYRGGSIATLIGQYLFADFVSGRVWSLSYDGSTATATRLFETDLFISSFGVDERGEIYLLSYGDGEILQLKGGA